MTIDSAKIMTHEPRPVLPHENRKVRGHALCSEGLFRAHVAEVEQLRARQAEYLASLPTDPREAIRAALELIHPNAEEYPDGIEEALHLSVALEALGAVSDDDAARAATAYVGACVSAALRRATRQIDLISDILHGTGRILREAAGRS
jgi:hypothetical protein